MAHFKSNSKLSIYYALIIICFFMAACRGNSGNQAAGFDGTKMDSATRMVVKKAPEWAQMLKHISGWIGADGIYALPLDGDERSGRRGSAETYDDIDFYTYNAKAYPYLSKPGELLISYNVNSFDFERKIKIHPYHLRPRFITLNIKHG
jgi:hypothetical protein